MTSSLSMFTKIAVASLLSITAIASQAATTSSSHSSSNSVVTYRVTGVVQQIDLAKNRITLNQDSVTELGWPVRAATYQVNSDNILKAVSPGQKVRATFTAESRFNPVLRSISSDSK